MPNGDLNEIRHGRPGGDASRQATGMLDGPQDLAQALRELGLGPAAPQSPIIKYLPTINVLLGVVLAATIAAAGTAYRA